jgi:hypothetical protein
VDVDVDVDADVDVDVDVSTRDDAPVLLSRKTLVITTG